MFIKCLMLSLTLNLFMSSAFAQLRLVAPASSELSDFNLRDGELFTDASKKTLFMFSQGDSYRVSPFVENLPFVKQFNSNSSAPNNKIHIGAGEILINGKVYKNTSSIQCDPWTTGLGAHEDSDEHTVWDWDYLYLIPDPRVGYETNFNCIVSKSHTGPTLPQYQNAWKRVTSIKGNSLVSHNGETSIGFVIYCEYGIPANTNTVVEYDYYECLPKSAESFIATVQCTAGSTPTPPFPELGVGASYAEAAVSSCYVSTAFDWASPITGTKLYLLNQTSVSADVRFTVKSFKERIISSDDLLALKKERIILSNNQD